VIQPAIHGLLFADDAVCLANTAAVPEQKVCSIQSWATKWHLKIGIKKCGIMVFRPLSFTTFDPAFTVYINAHNTFMPSLAYASVRQHLNA
jgi:hypothetical protein